MLRSVVLPRLTSQLLSCTRASCSLRSPSMQLLCGTSDISSHRGLTAPIQQSFNAPCSYQVTSLATYSDMSTQKYGMIYTLPHIKVLRAVSRLKLLQTGITLVILPPVYYLYLQGDVSSFLVSYTTGIALFAGIMLYTASHFLRKVVGMMYLDSSQTTLKVSHLTFWGRRHDVYLPVSDVMTIGDTGDSVGEPILKLKRYSSPQTMYFSTRFGRVVDRQAFEQVFGTIK
ncbi:transmembrane protein 186 [Polymixia lowei]